MKTARFVDVVEASGRPDVHILLTRAEDDKVLRAAIRSHRVMTIDQDRLRGKADRGTVGFDPGPSRQFLIFPRSLSQFAGRFIVAIKYDLLKGAESQIQPEGSETARGREKSTSKSGHSKPSASKIVPFMKTAPQGPRELDDEMVDDPSEQLDDAIGFLKQGKQASALKLLRKVARDLRSTRPKPSNS